MKETLICKLCAGSPEIELYSINSHDKQIKTDVCIGKEIECLINNGVITYGCCCGHGERNPSCIVDIRSKDKLVALGYKLHEFSEEHTRNGKYEIYLKTDVQAELRKLLKNKRFRYVSDREVLP